MLPYLFEEVLPEVSQWSEEAFVGCGLLVVLVRERSQLDGAAEVPGDYPRLLEVSHCCDGGGCETLTFIGVQYYCCLVCAAFTPPPYHLRYHVHGVS